MNFNSFNSQGKFAIATHVVAMPNALTSVMVFFLILYPLDKHEWEEKYKKELKRREKDDAVNGFVRPAPKDVMAAAALREEEFDKQWVEEEEGLRELTPEEREIVQEEFDRQWVKINEDWFLDQQKPFSYYQSFIDAVDPRKKNKKIPPAVRQPKATGSAQDPRLYATQPKEPRAYPLPGRATLDPEPGMLRRVEETSKIQILNFYFQILDVLTLIESCNTSFDISLEPFFEFNVFCFSCLKSNSF